MYTIIQLGLMGNASIVRLGFPGASSSSHRCSTFCYGFRVERHVSWKRCATGFEIRFLLFGGCVKDVSPISSNVYINHAVLKRQLAQWVQVKSITNVSAAARYTTIEDIRRYVCHEGFIVNVINIKINSQQQVYCLHIFIYIKGKMT